MSRFDAIRKRNLAASCPPSPVQDRFLNPDQACWADRHEAYRHPPGDMLADGFAPAGMTNTDFTVIRHEGEFHLFGVGGFPGCFTNWPGQYEHIFHATTGDLVDWTVHGKAVWPHPDNAYECNKVWPPYVLRHGGGFAMVYCGLDFDNCQCLCLVFSDDLFRWRRYEANPIVDAGRLNWTLKRPDGKVRHCRDPHVEKVGDVCYLYYATVAADGNPAVGLAASEDLRRWDDLGPCLKRTGGWVPESPLVLARGGKYYLMPLPNDRLYESDDPTDFHGARQVPVSSDVKVVAPEIFDRRGDDEFLIGFYGHKGPRISMGVMTWRADRVEIRHVSRPGELAAWGLG